MRTNSRRALLACFAMALVLTLGGCGDDDDGGNGNGDAVSNGDGNGEEAGNGDEATNGDDSADEEANGDPEAFCTELEESQHLFAPPEDGDYDRIHSELSAITPPAELADEWDQLLAGVDAYRGVDFSDEQALDAVFQDPAVAASMDADARITEWALEECDVDLDA